ncbi:MAG: flippase-like domain-containing protein [Bacteroidia bacterium]|nr:flippase-like domain-containing protein [Bacteroidia bacterium]
MTNISQNTSIKTTMGLPVFWNGLVKFLISSMLIYFIYNQLADKGDLSEVWSSFRQNIGFGNIGLLVLCVLLMPFNFILENYKWRYLLTGMAYVSFWRSLKAILCGATLGIVTPNRLGEYGGRVLYFESRDNWKAIIATGVGNLAQLIVILSIGWIGAIYFFKHQVSLHPMLTSGSIVLGLISVILLSILYFNIDLAIDLFRRFPIPTYIKARIRKLSFLQNLEILRSYSIVALQKVLTIGLLKYVVYMTQYLLLLYFFGIQVPFWIALAGIATIYLIQTSIPLPAFMGLLARGELALIIWGYYSDMPENILGASFSLWILNLLIPSIIGLVLIYKVNILKSLGYD